MVIILVQQTINYAFTYIFEILNMLEALACNYSSTHINNILLQIELINFLHCIQFSLE